MDEYYFFPNNPRDVVEDLDKKVRKEAMADSSIDYFMVKLRYDISPTGFEEFPKIIDHLFELNAYWKTVAPHDYTGNIRTIETILANCIYASRNNFRTQLRSDIAQYEVDLSPEYFSESAN